MVWQRTTSRAIDQLRPVTFQQQFTQTPLGSVLATAGETKVLCTVSVQEGVPRFLEGSGQGWLTAEYRMLPGATYPRQTREWTKLSGRTQEIQRLIGRSLRAALDLQALGERTLLVDADVLQADAGTRTTSINGGFVALRDAIAVLLRDGKLQESPIRHQVAAVSVGLLDGTPVLDLDYQEDVAAAVDLNIVMTEDLNLIEIQGTAEKQNFSRQALNEMLAIAETGIQEIMAQQNQCLNA
ncbi:MAG: ribonuclease PH [Cyanobacteria bacterium P01_H01_bin.121]